MKLNRNCTATAKCIQQWNCSLIYLILFTDVKQVAVENRKWRTENKNWAWKRVENNPSGLERKVQSEVLNKIREASHDNDNELNSSATMWR